jgi:hypothetical protein
MEDEKLKEFMKGLFGAMDELMQEEKNELKKINEKLDKISGILVEAIKQN